MARALAVFAAGLEGRVQLQLDALAIMQSTITELLVATREEAERRESGLAQALERVADVCGHAVEMIAADSGDRDAFLELLAEIEEPIRRLLESTTTVALPHTSMILGGSVLVTSVDIDLLDVEDSEEGRERAAHVDWEVRGPTEA
jgi:hypothetical protein